MNFENMSVEEILQSPNFFKKLYYYPLLAGSIAGVVGQEASASIQIRANSAFIWTKTTYYADILAAAQTDSTRVIPLVDVSLTDTGSQDNFQQAPIPLMAIAGTGKLPYILDIPYLFNPKSTIEATFSNKSAIAYDNVTMVLHGYQVFRYSKAA